MSDAIITSYTLVDFPTESDMTAFFVFIEQNYEKLASDLRANGINPGFYPEAFRPIVEGYGAMNQTGTWIGVTVVSP